MHVRARIVGTALLAAACTHSGGGGGSPGPHAGLVPGPAAVLSPSNPAATPKDEDACVMLAKGGVFHVAWLSNRDGNDELYVLRSADGLQWNGPHRVTTDADSDWYPTLIQTADERFHMVWMRQTATTRTVVYNSSADGITWDAADELPVTTGVSDDFVPYLVALGADLCVYFDSAERSSDASRNLFLVKSTAFDASGSVTAWSGPTELAVNDTTLNDQFPFVLRRPSGDWVMAWIRHSGVATQFSSYLDPSTTIVYATSGDGLSWNFQGPLMPDDATVDTMPSLYRAGGELIFTWMRGVSGMPDVMELALSDLAGWPASAVDVTASNGVHGWSPRAVATLKPNTYLRVFVGAADLRIHSQVFAR